AGWPGPVRWWAWRRACGAAWTCSSIGCGGTKETTAMASDRNDAGGYLGWFLLGGLLGAAAGLLLAAKTGRETRGLISGSELARRAQAVATEAQGRAGELLDKSSEL